jgi:hypothetical protein
VTIALELIAEDLIKSGMQVLCKIFEMVLYGEIYLSTRKSMCSFRGVIEGRIQGEGALRDVGNSVLRVELNNLSQVVQQGTLSLRKRDP